MALLTFQPPAESRQETPLMPAGALARSGSDKLLAGPRVTRQLAPGAAKPSDRFAAAPSMEPSAEDKLTWQEKSLYGAGGIVQNLMANAVFRLVNPVLNIGLHISPELVGFTMFLPRVWSMMTDPLIGRFSDNTRSRWGRRRPLMIGGAIAAGLALGLIFMGPTGGEGERYFLWVLGFSLLFYTAASVFTVPYAALGNEMSPDYHERTSISGYRAGGMYLGGFINQGLPFFAGLACWGGIVQGARVTSWILMAVIALIGAGVGFATKERYFPLVQGQAPVRLGTAIRQTFRLRSFLTLAMVSFIYWAGVLTVDALGVYINIYHVAAGTVIGDFNAVRQAGFEYQLYNGFTQHGVSLLLLPLVTSCSRRFGKMRVMQLGLLLTAVASALKFVCYTPGFWQLQLIVPLLMGPGQSCMIVITGSLLADVIDEDEWLTGFRREGIYSATMSWLQKMAFAVAVALNGLLLGASGFLAERELHQGPEAILALRICYSVVPIVACIGAAIILHFYTSNEKEARVIQSELQERRGTLGPTPA